MILSLCHVLTVPIIAKKIELLIDIFNFFAAAS
jgi:hypothetical protein